MKRTRKIALVVIAVVACIAISVLWWEAIGHMSAAGNSAKWLLWSHHYQAEVLAQPESTNGELKHAEWDVWGWVGMDTVVYVVFDPTDSLAQAARSRQPGKYSGLPCRVFLVRRLERHWYTVRFYTDKEWRPNC